jgi:hypothetical protein
LQLLTAVKQIERDMGRKPSERWGPRLIDIDILVYGDVEITSEELTIPHPEMWNRRFVLIPLLDVLPEGELKGRVRSELEQLSGGHEEVRPHPSPLPEEGAGLRQDDLSHEGKPSRKVGGAGASLVRKPTDSV